MIHFPTLFPHWVRRQAALTLRFTDCAAFYRSFHFFRRIRSAAACDLRLIYHGIRLCDLPDHPAGVSGGKGQGRNISCHHTACADDAAVSDGHAGAHHHVGAEPAVISDHNGLCIAQVAGLPVLLFHRAPLLRQHGVNRGHNGHIGAEIAVISDGYQSIVLHSKVKVREKVLPDPGVSSVMEGDGPLDPPALAEFSDDLVKEPIPLFVFILVSGIEIHI